MKIFLLVFLALVSCSSYGMNLSGGSKKDLDVSNKKKSSKKKNSKKNSAKKRHSKDEKRTTFEEIDELRYGSRSNGALTASRKGDSYQIRQKKNYEDGLENRIEILEQEISQMKDLYILMQEGYKEKIGSLEDKILQLQTFNTDVLRGDFDRVRAILKRKADREDVENIAKEMVVFSEQLKRKKSKKMLIKKSSSRIKMYQSSSSGIVGVDNADKKEILESFSSSSPGSISNNKKEVVIRKDSMSSSKDVERSSRKKKN